MKNILLFAPYGLWAVHHQLDAVVGGALKLRGGRVAALCCDGIFRSCSISGCKTDAQTCSICMTKSRELFQRFGIEQMQLGSVLTDADYEHVTSWVESISPHRIADVSFAGHRLWKWCEVGVFLKERTATIDLMRKETFAYVKDLLFNCALLVLAYSRFLAMYRPDNVVCYNAGHMYYRVAFELSRQASVDVLVHERGHTDDSFLLTHNRSNHFCAEPFEQWKQWSAAPLGVEQLDALFSLIEDREEGRNVNFISTASRAVEGFALAEALQLAPDRKTLAVFSSGDWEFGISASSGLTPIFSSQREWLQFVADFCEEKGITLVVRHHPLGAGSATYPRAGQFIADMLGFSLGFGRHVKVIMPAERIKSYDLLWSSDASSVVYSSVAWEGMARGVRPVYAAPSIFTGVGFATARSIAEYRGMLEDCLADDKPFSVDELVRFARAIYFTYFIVLSHRFKGFGFNGVYGEDIRVREVRELMPGHDPVLDRVCNHILYGTDVYEQAQPASAETERAYIERKYEAIVARRSQARASLLAERSQLPMAIVGVRDGGAEHAVFEASVARTRHEMIARHTVQVGGDTAQALAAIVQLVDSLDVSHVHVCSESAYVGEQVHVEAAHYLERHGCDVVRCGGYWLPDGKDVAFEVFTEAAGLSEEQALGVCPALQDVWLLLAHHVWKRDALLAVLRRLHAASLEGQDVVATLFALLATEMRMHMTGTPSIYVYGCGNK